MVEATDREEINMEKLIAALRVALGNTFCMYYKSHAYHWNVEGMFFSQYHKFFQKIYEDLYGAVDPLAENLRKLDVYAPISIAEIHGYKNIEEDSVKPENITEMLINLLDANTKTLAVLSETFDEATKEKQQGLANFIADRMDKHKMWEWQILASLKQIKKPGEE